MHKVFIAGAGNIGTCIAALLAQSKDYEVYLVDNSISHLALPSDPHLHIHQLDVTDSVQLRHYLKSNQIELTVSSLPYFHNIFVANAAADLNLHYFDLTEDITVSAKVRQLAEGKTTAFVSQCGVGPGFINIVANHLISLFDHVQATYLRAGCLPKSTNHALQYAITWSLDGLINEYGNPCYGLVHGQKASLLPLGDLEKIELEGVQYEAFNTSGGIGSLVETYAGRVQTLNYKTLRYPGHCEKMRFLMQDLHLKEERTVLKKIMARSLPETEQDIMLLYVAVLGEQEGKYVEQSYVKRIEPREMYGRHWTAIQISTASSLCAVVDLVLSAPSQYSGFVLQEQFSYTHFLQNRFGNIYNF